jgi:uncharacterized repeat protein (TIGR01451 family)
MERSRRLVSGRVLLVLAALAVGRVVAAGEAPSVRLVSKGGPGGQAIGGTNVAVSADGRYVAFSSSSGAGVPGLVDTNDGPDVFLFDRVTGETALVSRSIESPLRTANRESVPAYVAISADGRFVAFACGGTDLVADYSGVGEQLYLYSRVDHSVALVSHLPNAPSRGVLYGGMLPAIDADGGYVAFVSRGTELVGGPVDTVLQAFLFERSTGTVRLVSHTLQSETSPGGVRPDFAPAISADGSLVAFLSNTNLVTPAAEVVVTQVYLYRRADRGVALVSHAVDGATSFGDWPSTPPALSADGRFVTFSSASTNLVDGFVVGGIVNNNIYLYATADGTIDLISPAAGTTVTGGNGYSGSVVPPAISADGGLVAFTSWATNLVAGFQSPRPFELNVFLYSRDEGSVTLVSHLPGAPTSAGGSDSYVPVIASDGNVVAFESWATDLVSGADTDEALDVFAFERTTGIVSLASHALGQPGQAKGVEGTAFAPLYAVSADGRWTAYQSRADGLVAEPDPDGETDAFLFDRSTGANALVSRRGATGPDATASGRSALSFSGSALSADGRYAIFVSGAHDLVPGQADTDPVDVFIHDRVMLETRPVTPPAAVQAFSLGAGRDATISRDGRYVAFAAGSCVLLWSRESDTMEVLFTGFPTVCDGSPAAFAPSLSADGSAAAFFAANLAGVPQAYVWTRSGGVRVASHVAGQPGIHGNGPSGYPPMLSEDGRFLAFASNATNLVEATGAGDVNGEADVFLYSLETDSTVLVSHIPGSPLTAANRGSILAGVSADGGVVVLMSESTNLTGIVGNPGNQVYLYRRRTGEVTLVSHAAGSPNQAGNGPSGTIAAVSGSGRHVAFESFASDLVAGQEGSGVNFNVFLYSIAGDTSRLVSHVPGQATRTASGPSFVAHRSALSADGRRLLVISYASDIPSAPASTAGVGQLYVWTADTDDFTLVTRSAAGPAIGADAQDGVGMLSADGRWVAFDSPASNLVPRDHNGQSDVFLFGPTRPGADLAVGAAAPSTVTPAATVSATFVVVNLGPEAAAGVTLSLSSPPGFGSPTTSGACTAWPCSIGTLAAGQFVTLTVTFTVPSSYVAPDPAVVSLSASSSTPDPSPANDSVASSIAVTPRADLELSLTGPASATPPHHLAYTLTLTNRGPSDAASVAIDDPTPSGLAFLSSGGDCPSAFPCALGSLAPGAMRTAFATYSLPESYSGSDPIHNAAIASTATVDPNLGNNFPTLDTVLDAASPPLGFFTLPPCRLVDTRQPDSPFGGPPLQGGVERWFTATGTCGIPERARAVVLNATVTGSDGPGNLRLWAAGKPVPTAAVANFGMEQTRGTSAIVGLDAFGAFAAKAAGPTHVHLILDVAGYFE